MSKEKDFFNLFDKIAEARWRDSDLSKFNEQMNQLFDRAEPLGSESEQMGDVKKLMWNKIQGEIKSKRGLLVHRQVWTAIGVAASLILVAGITWLSYRNVNPEKEGVTVIADRSPISSKAVLKLASGERLYLNANDKGEIERDGRVGITRNADGLIHFDYNATTTSSAPRYDTLETSVGGVFKLRLSDGTLIALNASSRLRFPENFSEKRAREVELIEGEAYFDIVHNDKWKFKVQTAKGQIEDLGTKFVIKAYRDQKKMNATVEEGSVNIILSDGGRAILNPGQGAEINLNNQINVYQAKVAEETDWKDGVFRFEDARLEDIMAKIGTWYGIKINYGNASLKGKLFSGVVARSKKLSEVLEMLTTTGNIHFKIEENRILIN